MTSSRSGGGLIPSEVETAIWNCHLDGWRISEIARYSWQLFRSTDGEARECSPTEVRRVLAGIPPEDIRSDPRYLHGVRAFWIAASGYIEEEGVSVSGMVIAFQPPQLAGKVFQKAVRSICREFRSLSPGGMIDPNVMEGVEMEPVLRMLHSGRTIGWIIAEDGGISRYSGEFAPPDEAVPEEADRPANP